MQQKSPSQKTYTRLGIDKNLSILPSKKVVKITNLSNKEN